MIDVHHTIIIITTSPLTFYVTLQCVPSALKAVVDNYIWPLTMAVGTLPILI